MLEYRSTSILLKYIENEVQVQVQVCTSMYKYKENFVSINDVILPL